MKSKSKLFVGSHSCISSPKLTLCRARNAANLVAVTETFHNGFPGGSPSAPLLTDHTVYKLKMFREITGAYEKYCSPKNNFTPGHTLSN